MENSNLTLCKVLTQYYDENGKPKSGLEFQVRVDSDVLFYAPKEVIELTFQKMIDATTQSYCGKYVYHSYELVFHEPMQLTGDFDDTYEQAYYEIYPNEKNEVSEFDMCKEEVKKSLE